MSAIAGWSQIGVELAASNITHQIPFIIKKIIFQRRSSCRYDENYKPYRVFHI